MAKWGVKQSVRAKPLVWEESFKGHWVGAPFERLGDLSFLVFQDGREYTRFTKDGKSMYPTLEAAKAGAQADYEARILSHIIIGGE